MSVSPAPTSTAQTPAIDTATQTAMDKLQAIRSELNWTVIDREQVVDCLLIALLAQQHILLVGAPGTGKSLVINTLCREHLQGVNLFSILMTKFTNMNEVFGPWSLSALDHDRYDRVLDGRLAQAHVAFLDEFYKANSAIGNALLKILNERRFDTGQGEIDVPLVTMCAASNELPDPDSNDLGALHDRIGARLVVPNLNANGRRRLRQMILQGNPNLPPAPTTLDLVDLQALHAAVERVQIGPAVEDAQDKLWGLLEEERLEPSTRKFTQSLTWIKASAVLGGRLAADDEDIAILEHLLWERLDDRRPVAQAVAKCGSTETQRARALVDKAQAVYDRMAEEMAKESDPVKKTNLQTKANLEMKQVKELAERLLHECKGAGKPTGRAQDTYDRVYKLHTSIVRDLAAALGMSGELDKLGV